MTAVHLRPWMAFPVAGLAALTVAALGATLTDLGPWYQSLQQPSWKPPDWLFGPAWTLIFGLAALSAVTGWQEAPDQAAREWLIGLFALNGSLNVLWSLLFFHWQQPDWAVAEIALLWLSILCLMAVMARYSKRGCLLLAPYLAWVSFAAILNLSVVLLNAPF